MDQPKSLDEKIQEWETRLTGLVQRKNAIDLSSDAAAINEAVKDAATARRAQANEEGKIRVIDILQTEKRPYFDKLGLLTEPSQVYGNLNNLRAAVNRAKVEHPHDERLSTLSVGIESQMRELMNSLGDHLDEAALARIIPAEDLVDDVSGEGDEVDQGDEE